MSKPLPKELQAQQIKIPLHSRLLKEVNSWLRARRARKAAHKAAKEMKLVATLKVSIGIQGDDAGTRADSWFHCYENGYGKRDWKYQEGALPFDPYKAVYYNQVILPWLHGRYTTQALADFGRKTRVDD